MDSFAKNLSFKEIKNQLEDIKATYKGIGNTEGIERINTFMQQLYPSVLANNNAFKSLINTTNESFGESFATNLQNILLGVREPISDTEILTNKLKEVESQLRACGETAKANKIKEMLQKVSKETTDVKGSMQELRQYIEETFGTDVLKQFDKELKNIDKTTNKVGKKSNFGQNLKTALGIGTVALGIRKGWNFLKSSTTESVDFVEQQNLFNVSMGKTVDQYGNLDREASKYYTKAISFQEKLEEKLGTNIAESMQYQALFNAMSKSMGISADYAYKLSENFTKLGYDISSLYNIDPENAMQKLRAGLSGQTKPLRDLGLDITQQSIEPLLDQLGIERSAKQLSQAEKMIARYILVLKQASLAHGDFAKTMDSPANQLRIFNAQLTAFKRNLGNLWQGLLGNILPYVNAIMMVINELLKMVAKLFGFKVESQNISAGIGVDDLSDDLGTAIGKAKELKNQLMGFDEINNITLPDKSSGGSGTSVGGIDQRLLDAMKEYDNMMDKVKSKANDIRDKMMEWLGFHRTDDGWKLNEGLTNAEKILDVMKAIGVAIGTWKVSKTITNLMKNLGILNKTQAFQIAFGLTLTATGIFAQYKGTQHLLDGDIDIFTLLETFLGTTAGAFGISTLLKGLSKGKHSTLTLGNRLAIGFGVMLGIQGIQVLKDGLNSQDVKKSLLGAFESIGGGLVASWAIGGLKLAIPVTIALSVVELAMGVSSMIPQMTSDEVKEQANKQISDSYEMWVKYAKEALDKNNPRTIEDYNNSTKEYIHAYDDDENSLGNKLENIPFFGEQLGNAYKGLKEITGTEDWNDISPKIRKQIEEYRNLALVEAQIFDNGGQSIQNYYNNYKNLIDEIIGSQGAWVEYNNAYKENYEAVEKSSSELDILLSKLGNSTYKATAEDFKQINNALDEMTSYTKASGDAFINSAVAITDKLKEEGFISQETANTVVANAIRKAEAEGNAQEAYNLKIKDLNTQLQKGIINQKEFDIAVAEAKQELNKTKEVLDTTKTSVEGLHDIISEKIDMGNWGTAKDYVSQIGDTFIEAKGKAEEHKKSTIDATNTQIAEVERLLNELKEKGEEETDEYKRQQDALEELKNARIKTNEEYEKDIEETKEVTYRTLRGIQKQLIDRKYDITEDAAGIWKSTNEQLSKIGLDTNIAENIDKELGYSEDKIKKRMPSFFSLMNNMKNIITMKADGTFDINFSVNANLGELKKNLQTTRNTINKMANIPVVGSAFKSYVNNIDKAIEQLRVNGYAEGGFPVSGEMFIARENGIPEMVGQIGSKTAVANNDQIVESIKAGVYEAVAMAMSQYGGANVQVEARVDEGIIFKKVQSGAREYTRQTGTPAFEF